MITNVIHGSNHTEPKIRRLLDRLHRQAVLTGQLVTGYPLFPMKGQRPFSPDAVLVSGRGQVTVIDVVEGAETGDHKDRQDLAYNQVRSRLFSSRLHRGRQLMLHIQTVTYAPDLPKAGTSPHDEETPVVNDGQLMAALERFQALQGSRHPEANLEDETVMAILCNYRHGWGEE